MRWVARWCQLSGMHGQFRGYMCCLALVCFTHFCNKTALIPGSHWNLFKDLCRDRSKTNYILLDSTIRNLIESFQLYENDGYIQHFPCRTKNIGAVCCTATRIKQLTGHKLTCKYKTMWLPNSGTNTFFEMISSGVSLFLKHNFPRWRNIGQFFHAATIKPNYAFNPSYKSMIILTYSVGARLSTI